MARDRIICGYHTKIYVPNTRQLHIQNTYHAISTDILDYLMVVHHITHLIKGHAAWTDHVMSKMLI